jgi:type IV pilus assembly protein PilC
MITKLADFYEDEVSSSVKSLTSIMEPLMIIFVAVFVGIILIAMYLPMFSMMSTVG